MLPGDKVNVYYKVRSGWRKKEYEFLDESTYSIRLTNGKYSITINKYDLKTGKVRIESEEDKMIKKAKSIEALETNSKKGKSKSEYKEVSKEEAEDKPQDDITSKAVNKAQMQVKLIALKGKFIYRISENKISIKKPGARVSMVIEKNEIPSLVNELQNISKEFL